MESKCLSNCENYVYFFFLNNKFLILKGLKLNLANNLCEE